MADNCGVSRSYLTNVVNGKATPNFEIIKGIAQHYKNIDERWLLTGEGKMYKQQKLSKSPKLEDKLGDVVKLLVDEIRTINSRLDELERKLNND